MGNCAHRLRAVPLFAAARRVNRPEESARALRNWAKVRAKLRRIRRYIRLRLYWHHIGVYLQDPSIQSLLLGIERRAGKVVRARSAEAAQQQRTRRAGAKAAARSRLP
jgi:hypothetical protein